jgi:membrane-associated phospholipid phosphatase
VAFQADQPPSPTSLLAAGAVVAGCLGLFALIAEDVLDGGGLISHDEAVLSWFVDHRTDWLITAARWVSAIGGFAGLCVAGVAVGLVLWSRRVAPALAAAPLLALLLGGLAALAAKAAFGRERPPIALHETTVGVASFPSTHATDAAAFLIGLGLVLALTAVRQPRRKVAVVAAGAAGAGIVGLSRLVLAVHWLSDVVAGWALGTALATAIVVLAWIVASGSVETGSRPAVDHFGSDPAGGFAEA